MSLSHFTILLLPFFHFFLYHCNSFPFNFESLLDNPFLEVIRIFVQLVGHNFDRVVVMQGHQFLQLQQVISDVLRFKLNCSMQGIDFSRKYTSGFHQIDLNQLLLLFANNIQQLLFILLMDWFMDDILVETAHGSLFQPFQNTQ